MPASVAELDLPAPELPTAPPLPAPSHGCSASPGVVIGVDRQQGHFSARNSSSAATVSAPSRSALVSTTTGCTPLRPPHQVAARSARVVSASSPQTTNTVSMLAAINLLLVVLARGTALDRGQTVAAAATMRNAFAASLRRPPSRTTAGAIPGCCRPVVASARCHSGSDSARCDASGLRPQVTAAMLLSAIQPDALRIFGKDHGPVRRQRMGRPAPADGLQGGNAWDRVIMRGF